MQVIQCNLQLNFEAARAGCSAYTMVGFSISSDGDSTAALDMFDHTQTKKYFPIFRHNFLYVIVCLLSPVFLLVVTEKSVAPFFILPSLNIFTC